MAKNIESNHSTSNKSTKRKKKNIILWIAFVILLIPCLILGYLIIDSTGNKHEPIPGNRFDHDLNPEIKKEQLNQIETSLKNDSVQKVSINLKSATLRILIDTNDDLNAQQIEGLANQAFDQVASILPIETYFTNEKKKMMYDLEIHVYNVIPQEGVTVEQIYYLKSKNAAAKEPLLEVLTQPKNAEVANPLLNPPAKNEEKPVE